MIFQICSIAFMDYINIYSIKVTEKLLFIHLLSFTELHGITYITGHYTFRPPAIECKQLLYYTGNNALKIGYICRILPVAWGEAEVEAVGTQMSTIRFMARSLNQTNMCTFQLFRLKVCFSHCYFTNKQCCFPW